MTHSPKDRRDHRGKQHEMYRREHLIGPLLVHKTFGSQTLPPPCPPPLPPTSAQKPPWRRPTGQFPSPGPGGGTCTFRTSMETSEHWPLELRRR